MTTRHPSRARLGALALSVLAFAVPVAGCTGDEGDIAARREAAREVARQNRDRAAPGPVVRDTNLPLRYDGLPTASVEEVAAAMEEIPVQARRIRTAKAIGEVEVRLLPEPVVVGPRARGDLQIDNTAPLDTIRNAIEGSALAYTRVRANGVVIADIVAATLEGDALTVFVAVPD